MSAFEKWLLWSSTAAVTVSGVVFGWMKYVMTAPDPYAVVHHPWQPFMLKAHVLSAPVLVFALGIVFTRHVLRQWAAQRAGGRRTGAGIVVTLAPMVASGYLIQTLTSESWLFRVAMLHVAASLLYLAGLTAHQIAAWRERSRLPRGREPLAGTSAPIEPDA